MSSLLSVIEELDNLLFEGRQKVERRTAVHLHNILFSFGLSVDHNHVTRRLPFVIRNLEVSLKDEHAKKVFQILEGQESTELDILFIDAPSLLGHGARLNYYAEIETQQRDTVAFQRLLDFSAFCKGGAINLFPILVTKMRRSGYVQDICVINIDDLRRAGSFYERYLVDIEQIPGLAYDDAACCFYILDLLSREERVVKERLLEELRKRHVLKQKTVDFTKVATGNLCLGDCLEPEEDNNFNKRMVGYIRKLKEMNVITNTPDGRAHQLTPLGGKLILKWRSGL